MLKLVPMIVFAVGGGLLAFDVTPSHATNARMAVPDNGGGVAGCYRIREQLYGPYRMTFCLEDYGYYRVTGGGLDCDGGLAWRDRRGEIQIDLRRAECGRATQWTADRITCRAGRTGGGGGGPNARVAVPDGGGSVGSLNCTYKPSEAGYRPMRVTAVRIY